MLVLLAASGVITTLNGTIAAPGTLPDEKHHFAYIQYVAEHFGEFPVAYRNIFTDFPGNPNHLIHPPLYYYLMALPYLWLDPLRDYPALGEELSGPGINAAALVAIPVLRVFSRCLVLLGLYGSFRFLVFLVGVGLLRPWSALVATALISFVPAFLYTGAGLNNDALSLALWPFLAVCCLGFFLQGRRDLLWPSVFLIGACVLTKATLWFMALVFGCLVLWRAGTAIRQNGLRFLFPWAGAASKTRAIVASAWGCMAMLMALTVCIHLVSNLLRYDRLQPSYTGVFNLRPEETPFYRSPEGVRKSTFQIAAHCATQAMMTTTGFVGHREAFFREHPNRQVLLLFLAVALLLLSGGRALFSEGVQKRQRLMVGVSFGMGAGFFLLLVFHNLEIYRIYNSVASPGRYLIGYLQLILIGLVVISSLAFRSIPRRFESRQVGVGAGLLLLFWLFFDPFIFIKNTGEFYRQAEIYKSVERLLSQQGFEELYIDASWPPDILTGVESKKNTFGRERTFLIPTPGIALGGTLKHSQNFVSGLELAIWAMGGELSGNEALLGVGLFGPDTSWEEAPILASLALPQRLDVRYVTLSPPEDFLATGIFLKYVGPRGRSVPFFQRPMVQNLGPRITGVFYRDLSSVNPSSKTRADFPNGKESR